MTTIDLPERVLPMAEMIQRLLRDAAPQSYPVPTLDTIQDVLLALGALAGGPRYAAEHDGTHDSLGNPGYVVRDRRTGAVVGGYEGYFAGQDARGLTSIMNDSDPER